MQDFQSTFIERNIATKTTVDDFIAALFSLTLIQLDWQKLYVLQTISKIRVENKPTKGQIQTTGKDIDIAQFSEYVVSGDGLLVCIILHGKKI